jgi:hypothetical protein
VIEASERTEAVVSATATEDPDTSVRDRILPLVSMLISVVLAGLLPFVGDRRFYLADDNVVSWMPTSRRIGALLRGGESHLMDPDMWWAGNFVASARYGIWNPLILLLDVTVLQLDDFAVAMLIVTLVYLTILAVGVYLLAREYDAAPWPAALAGLVAATGGWTLWMDATWWTPQLTSLAFTPFLWIAARRLARGVGSPVWVLLAGWMCVTAGNPYSNLVVLAVFIAVAAEFFDRRHLRNIVALGATLTSIGLVALFVYLPVRLTAHVGWREAGIANNEWWSPGLGDFALMSSPIATPFVPHFGRGILEFPAAYLSWFVLPLAPWLAWRSLRHRQFVGLAVVGGIFVLLALGPSDFWLFRWPFRLVPYVYLPIAIGVAVLLSSPLRSDRADRRAAITVSIIVIGAYLSWAEVPTNVPWHLASALLIGAGMAAVIVAATRRPRVIGPALMFGTLAVLGMQLQFRSLNGSVSELNLPRDAAFYDEHFADRYDGTVIQIASFDAIAPTDRNNAGAYQDVTIGSMSTVTGIDGLNTYSGLGFNTFANALCLRFDGAACADAWNRLWETVDDDGQSLADLLSLDTVVVQRSVLDTTTSAPPPGWLLAEETDHVAVWKRNTAEQWPGSRLSGVSGPLAIDEVAPAEPHRESVTLRRLEPGAATLTFSRLAWPGYEASIDGRPLAIGEGPAGLVTVTLPDDVDTGTVALTWTPPYWRRVLAVLILGLLIGLATDLVWRWQRRRGVGLR